MAPLGNLAEREERTEKRLARGTGGRVGRRGVGMPVSHASSSTLVPDALPVQHLRARIDGRLELSWLPPNKLPAEGAFVHVSECPDRLSNMSKALDINNLCNKPWWTEEEEMTLRATSYVRPERPGLFFSSQGTNKEMVAFVMPETTVYGGWPHDSWGSKTADQRLCSEDETPGDYARRRLDHFVRHCDNHEANRWWASNFTCFYRTRAAIEERQYAYLDLVRDNGTKCTPGQLHNQIMVKWEPEKITRILHTKTASQAAHRLKALMPPRPLWQYGVNVSAVLERCDSCCREPDCPNPLKTPNSAASPAAQRRRQQEQEEEYQEAQKAASAWAAERQKQEAAERAAAEKQAKEAAEKAAEKQAEEAAAKAEEEQAQEAAAIAEAEAAEEERAKEEAAEALAEKNAAEAKAEEALAETRAAEAKAAEEKVEEAKAAAAKAAAAKAAEAKAAEAKKVAAAKAAEVKAAQDKVAEAKKAAEERMAEEKAAKAAAAHAEKVKAWHERKAAEEKAAKEKAAKACPKPTTWCVHEGASNAFKECGGVLGHFCTDTLGQSGFSPCECDDGGQSPEALARGWEPSFVPQNACTRWAAGGEPSVPCVENASGHGPTWIAKHSGDATKESAEAKAPAAKAEEEKEARARAAEARAEVKVAEARANGPNGAGPNIWAVTSDEGYCDSSHAKDVDTASCMGWCSAERVAEHCSWCYCRGCQRLAEACNADARLSNPEPVVVGHPQKQQQQQRQQERRQPQPQQQQQQQQPQQQPHEWEWVAPPPPPQQRRQQQQQQAQQPKQQPKQQPRQQTRQKGSGPQCDPNCADVQPPSHWAYPRCAGQLANGKCAERVSMADGYCELTCGICVAC